MTDKERWLDYRNRISMGLGLEGKQTDWVFEKALESIKKHNEIYVTLTCAYGGEGTGVGYVGTNKEKAYGYSQSDDENGWYVWVETWVNGEKIKSEDI